MAWVRRAWRKGVREEPALLRPLKGKPARIWRMGAGRGAYLPFHGGELPGRHAGAGPGGHGEVLRGNRGEAAGAELGSSSAERITVNAGTVPVLPVPDALPARGAGWARRRPTGPERGGAAVVLRAGESPRTWGRAAVVARREGGC